MNSTMWLILLFLLRPYVIFVLSVANRSNRMQLIDMIYTDKMMLSLGALVGVPAALLIYAWTRRAPGAPHFVKQIWKNGRHLIAISSILNAGIVVAAVLGRAHKVDVYGGVQLLVSLVIVAISYMSSYLRDCFADFPEEES